MKMCYLCGKEERHKGCPLCQPVENLEQKIREVFERTSSYVEVENVAPTDWGRIVKYRLADGMLPDLLIHNMRLLPYGIMMVKVDTRRRQIGFATIRKASKVWDEYR